MSLRLKVWWLNLLFQVGIVLGFQHQIRPLVPDHFGLNGPDSFVTGHLGSVLTMILLFNVAGLLFMNLAPLLVTRLPFLAQHASMTKSVLRLIGWWVLVIAWTTLPWCLLPAATWMETLMNVVDLCFLGLLILLLGRNVFKRH